MKITRLDQLTPQGLSHDADIMRRVLLAESELPGSVRLSHAIFKPGQQAAPHRHDDLHEIFYVISGAGVFCIDGCEHRVSAGSCIRIDPHEEHEVINNGLDDMILLYFGLAAEVDSD